MESYAWGEAADVWIGYDGCIMGGVSIECLIVLVWSFMLTRS
jgi:hypothetical protein